MGATKSVFKYKCALGHVTTKLYPLGTRIDDYDETSCVECLRPAYIVFACFTSAEKKK